MTAPPSKPSNGAVLTAVVCGDKTLQGRSKRGQVTRVDQPGVQPMGEPGGDVDPVLGPFWWNCIGRLPGHGPRNWAFGDVVDDLHGGQS